MKRMVAFLAVAVTLGCFSLVNAGTSILSLNPYSALLGDDASFQMTGFNGPIRLPGNGSTPNFALGFTIPHDYVANSTINVIILWNSTEENCTYCLQPNILYRARSGKPMDGGNAVGGLLAVRSSTPYVYTGGGGISMEAPDPYRTTERVTFSIKPTPGEFDSLKAGDAVNFGFFRNDSNDANDSCTGEIRISGISIQYKTP